MIEARVRRRSLLGAAAFVVLGGCSRGGADGESSGAASGARPAPTGSFVDSTAPDVHRGIADALAAAMRGGDRTAFAGVFGTSASARALAARLWLNWRSLRVEGVVAAGAALEVSWRGAGESAAVPERVLPVVSPGGRLEGLGPDVVTPLWLTDEVRVRRGTHGTVVSSVTVPARRAAVWSEAAEVGARHVARRLAGSSPGWDGSLVVVLPARIPSMAAALGWTASQAAASRAVTRKSLAGAPRTVGNSVGTASLTRAGVAGLLAHEGIHVATRSTGSPAPLWAVEGLAESVGTELDPEQARRNRALVLQRVARGVPKAPPTDAELAAAGAEGETAYALAEVAVEALMARDGRGPITAWVADPRGHPAPADVERLYASALSSLRPTRPR